MARRSMAGQLNMFDFWDNLVQPEDGAEVQMVSLIPEEEPKQKSGEDVDEEAAQEEQVAQKVTLPETENFAKVDAGIDEAMGAGAERAQMEEAKVQEEALPETVETVAAGTTGMDLKPEEKNVQEAPVTDVTGKASEAEGVEADFKQEEAVPEKKVQEELVTQKVTLPEEEKSENNDAETLSVDKEKISRLPETAPVMQKQVLNPDGSIKAEVAYYNYNKVCVKRENEPAEWREFDNSKEAVDYYIEEMLKLQPGNGFEDKGEDDE